MKRLAIRGDLLDFTGTPAWGDVEAAAVRFREDRWLLIEGGAIAGALPGDALPDASWERSEASGRLILRGFIDTHVHSPPLEVIASYGTGLPDRLACYTFAPLPVLGVGR